MSRRDAPALRSRRIPAFALLAGLAGAAALGAQPTGFGSIQIDDSTGETSAVEASDRFGGVLAAGFFDDDPYEDLAVGVPDEDIGGLSNTGAVRVFYGSPGGIRLTGDQGFLVSNTIGSAKADDRFGAALAAGDLDGDGLDDLVVGVPGRDTASQNGAGAVVVLRGTPGGLDYDSTFCGLLHQNRTDDSSGVGGVDNAVAAGESFGESVAILPATPTGVPWIAIGVPGENVAGVDDSGMVELVLTRASGSQGCLETTGAVTTFALFQSGPLCEACGEHYEGQLEVDDRFGTRLAVGDFDDDGVRDLAVGVPYEDIGSSFTDAGVAQVFYAAANGLFPTADDQVWSQDSAGVQESAESQDYFGIALAAGDFDAEAGDDLAIGAYAERLFDGDPESRIPNAGVLHVLYSAGASGLSGDGDLLTDGPEEEFQYFGEPLLAADLDGSGAQELLLGFPQLRSPFTNTDRAGAARVYFGQAGTGIGANTYTSWSQQSTNVPDTSEAGDNFGDGLAAGDFDGNGFDDLAIGAPGEDLEDLSSAGAVTILYSLNPANDAFGAVQYVGSGTTVAESVGSRTVTIRRNGGAPASGKVSYDNSGGTATEGQDHGTVGGSRTWAAGDLADKTFAVAITNDTLDEGNETIRIPLSSPTFGLALGSPNVYTITIQDDDEGGVLRFIGSSFGFAESIGTVGITVQRVDGEASGVSVHVASSAGTATSGDDFGAVSANLAFSAGEASESVQLTIVDDELDESDETLSLVLSGPTGGATLGSPATLPITIVDDEGPGFLRFASGTASASESVGTAAVTVDYATISGGSAAPGDDYVVDSGTLQFADGETTGSVPVEIVDDDDDEGDETVRLELSNPTGGADLTFPETRFLTILDDDGGPVALFADDFEAGDACNWTDADGLEPPCLP